MSELSDEASKAQRRVDPHWSLHHAGQPWLLGGLDTMRRVRRNLIHLEAWRVN